MEVFRAVIEFMFAAVIPAGFVYGVAFFPVGYKEVFENG